MPAAGLPQLRPPLRPAPPPAEVQSPSSPPTVARGSGASQGSRAPPAIWATCPPTWAALGCWLLGALHVPPLPTYHPQALPLLLQALPFNPSPSTRPPQDVTARPPLSLPQLPDGTNRVALSRAERCKAQPTAWHTVGPQKSRSSTFARHLLGLGSWGWREGCPRTDPKDA